LIRVAHRARRAHRGAALVEAVVVLPVFVALLAALVYFERLYSGRLVAARDARAAAWQTSLAGCEGRPAAAEVPLPAALGRYAAAAGGARVVAGSGTTTAIARQRVGGDAVLGLLPAEVTAEAELVCNERIASGDLAGVLRYGWDRARFW